MDNFRFDIISDSNIDLALQLAFTQHQKATHWQVQHQGNCTARFVLAWADPPGEGWHPFPSPVSSEQVVETVKEWLKNQDYGPQPDHDGDNGKGWRIYNEAWGHIGGTWQAFVAIEPVWAMYGK